MNSNFVMWTFVPSTTLAVVAQEDIPLESTSAPKYLSPTKVYTCIRAGGTRAATARGCEGSSMNSQLSSRAGVLMEESTRATVYTVVILHT